MIFGHKCSSIFCTQILFRLIQATYTFACHSEVSIRFFGLWSPRRIVVAFCDVGPMFLKPRWIVEIELLATVGWKCGCQPFRCPCSQNVTQCQTRFVGHVMFVFRNPFQPFLLGIPSIQSLREAWVPESGSTFRQLCIMLWLHHAHPFFAAAEKYLSYAEKQRVWSCGVEWLCSQLCYVTAANQWTIVEIELLEIVGWKWGCQPFSGPCVQNVTHRRKEICSTCLFKESIPATPFGNFNHPLPARSRFLIVAARSTTSALWLHHAHPFVAAAGKNLSHAEKQMVWSRSCDLQDLLQCSDCALSFAVWLLDTDEQLSRLRF